MNHYFDRIDNVIKYIEDNLSGKISLEELAEISNFSRYHFSRIFSSVVGMTPYAYLNNRRLTKSVEYLVNTDKTVLEISILCGFHSVSNFNQAFKKRYNNTPSEVRRDSKQFSNISLHYGKKQEETEKPARYSESEIKNHLLRRIWEMNIAIKELPDYEVAYVRHVGSYLETYKAWGKLGVWAGKNNLFPPEHIFIGISFDDPSTTDEYACRYDACVTIKGDFKRDVDPDIKYKTLYGGLYALYPFYDKIEQFAIVYQLVYGQWLPNSEYDPDDKPCLEFCMNNPSDDPEGKAKIDLYIPIRKRKV
ncbi:AraC family transcriptional regulator [Paenibacillus forsythiae]|uniref:AraC family transcriptional regulator n=1 Tax=Paenibacillus forsythiae TaxID=365616 RepID=A0ABU3HEJ9_9BACL|nr:AraC family transcriptional regulator [Paenibacillus forsythiae]MDT3429234.1 AraC family transcriptional regulator [Paenibacillus forsythiae]